MTRQEYLDKAFELEKRIESYDLKIREIEQEVWKDPRWIRFTNLSQKCRDRLHDLRIDKAIEWCYKNSGGDPINNYTRGYFRALENAKQYLTTLKQQP